MPAHNVFSVGVLLEGIDTGRVRRYDLASFSGLTAFVRLLPFATGGFRPILLKKSAMVSTAEEYASELEIFALSSRGFRVQISRRCAQKRNFQQSVHAQPGRSDFFNTIGQKRSLTTCRTVLRYTLKIMP